MSTTDTFTTRVVRDAKSYLSSISVVYIFCVAPLYLIWNLSSLDRWRLLLLFAALPSSVAIFFAHCIFRIAIKVPTRRIGDPLLREAYEWFNLNLIRKTFVALLVTALAYNLFTRQQTYGPDEAQMKIWL